MRLVRHSASADGDCIATTVDVADSFLSRARGLMFRRSIPDDYALVFPFGEPKSRTLHMLFVPFAIDAVWIHDGEVTAVKRLRPLVGIGRGRGDVVVELPAGAAADVELGDRIEFLTDGGTTVVPG
ncbi:DUF192 domain-containing protein [Halopenitus persicus]|uniref:DUF192 domain-containing protein n=1 Tax=Halopenitus persicus TaxID=1048396 RepID=A0A1H3IDZ5_9EURY|nr:DUF192 domain-containing protein [Halopenitus persicus]SDY25489.1 hypothetical protein SAMN05216564_10474 [Halopenitus persicus]